MNKKEGIAFLERVNGSAGDFIIKDNTGITIGRIYLVELSDKNSNCTFRLKCYKMREESYFYLKEALQLLLKYIFHNLRLNKANIITSEEINYAAFTEIGFFIEGIITENLVVEGYRKAELLFGINSGTFDILKKERTLNLKGESIELRILTPGDSAELLEYYVRNKEHLRAFEPARDESFYKEELQKRSLIDSYKQFLVGSNLNMGIYKEDNLIGKIQLSGVIMGVFKNGFIGYSIDKDQEGKGYMKEAVLLLADYAFSNMDIHRLEASTLVDNYRSQGVLKACGFNELGVSKDYLFINNDWRDHKIFYKVK